MAAHILPWRTGLRFKVKKQAAIRTLQEAEGSEAGLVILDPPSEFGVGEDAEEEESKLDRQIISLTSIVEEVKAALAPGGSVMIIGDPPMVTAWDVAANWTGDLRYRSTIVVLWDRSRNNRGPAAHLPASSMHTLIQWRVKTGHRYGRTIPTIETKSDVVVCRDIPVSDKKNPTQRPVELFNFLLSICTRRGDLVVDPFCGSGSSLVAAEMNGRRWIAGDTDKEQCKIAERRTQLIEIEEAELQPMFWWRGNGKPIEIAV